jgi:hypothetical protein
LAFWAPTFVDCSLAELEAATLQLSEDASKHPKGRPECRSMLKRLIIEGRRRQGIDLDAEWRSLPTDRQQAIKAEVLRLHPGAPLSVRNAACYELMKGTQ